MDKADNQRSWFAWDAPSVKTENTKSWEIFSFGKLRPLVTLLLANDQVSWFRVVWEKLLRFYQIWIAKNPTDGSLWRNTDSWSQRWRWMFLEMPQVGRMQLNSHSLSVCGCCHVMSMCLWICLLLTVSHACT